MGDNLSSVDLEFFIRKCVAIRNNFVILNFELLKTNIPTIKFLVIIAVNFIAQM